RASCRFSSLALGRLESPIPAAPSALDAGDAAKYADELFLALEPDDLVEPVIVSDRMARQMRQDLLARFRQVQAEAAPVRDGADARQEAAVYEIGKGRGQGRLVAPAGSAQCRLRDPRIAVDETEDGEAARLQLGVAHQLSKGTKRRLLRQAKMEADEIVEN